MFLRLGHVHAHVTPPQYAHTSLNNYIFVVLHFAFALKLYLVLACFGPFLSFVIALYLHMRLLIACLLVSERHSCKAFSSG